MRSNIQKITKNFKLIPKIWVMRIRERHINITANYQMMMLRM